MNAPMWSELFLENSDFMLRELDCLVENLLQYRAALAAGDGETLTALIEAGKRSKIAVYAEDKNIDAVGACVGSRGSRINRLFSRIDDIILCSVFVL